MRRFRLSCRLLTLLLLAAIGARALIVRAQTTDNTPGNHEYSLKAAGFTWTYAVHIPKGYDPAKPVPMVMILHGAGGQGSFYLNSAEWAAKSDKEGFIAVAPDGLPARPLMEANPLTNPRLWNSGKQIGARSPRSRVDDVAFFKALLDEAETRWKIDPKRVFLTGHSNGAGMTFHLANELSERFTAVAAVASQCWEDDPRPKRPMPTLFIIGTADAIMPIAGGESRLPWGSRTVPPLIPTLERWAKGLGCPTTPKTLKDGGGLKIQQYGPGTDGAFLRTIFITGQGHSWPGARHFLRSNSLGPTVNTLDATDEIWKFFKERG